MSFVSDFLGKLVAITDWAQMSDVCDFVEWVTISMPELAAIYYIDRLTHWQLLPSDQRLRYHPVPYITNLQTTNTAAKEGDALGQEARIRALRAVRDRTLGASGTREMGHLTEIYSRLSRRYADPALDVLLEWIDSSETQKVVNAARLLENADSHFVFANEAYVVHLLEAAQQLGEDVLRQVRGSLVKTAKSDLAAGWVGVPDPADVELRDKAAEVSQRYEEGHVAHDFYGYLGKIAAEGIEMSMHTWDVLENE